MFEGLDYGLNHRSDHILEKFELFVGGWEVEFMAGHKKQNVSTILKNLLSLFPRGSSWDLILLKKDSFRSQLNPVFTKPSNNVQPLTTHLCESKSLEWAYPVLIHNHSRLDQ